MNIFGEIRHYFSKVFFKLKETEPEAAYDIWASSYDQQPDNLMLALDEEVFSGLLKFTDLKNKTIADVGCGTGRHWKKIVSNEPKKLFGFDVSEGMLKILMQKFPQAETFQLKNNKLDELANDSCDFIMSTLTIAHIENADDAIKEWNRVLKPGGQMLITDYHPSALAKGGKRTFKHHEQTVAVKNYVHSLGFLKNTANRLNLEIIHLVEKRIDDSVKHYYEKQNALDVFETWKGVPIIYGMILKKPDAS